MIAPKDIDEYMRALKASPAFGPRVAFHQVIPARPADFSPGWNRRCGGTARRILDAMGVDRLYTHQATALDGIAGGEHVVVATATASGKSLVFNLPVIEAILEKPDSRALYLFPLKALAQDQLHHFNAHCRALGEERRIRAAIYDGDTTSQRRAAIRRHPPHVVMTNPEMLHLSLLAHHTKWQAFLKGLAFVVVDEVHTFRGFMGSHMAQVFRRLRRLCGLYGSRPQLIFCSATVAEPAAFVRQLAGVRARAVLRSGAPAGRQHLAFIDPDATAAGCTLDLLHAALHRRLRTIVYTRSRRMTELVALRMQARLGAGSHLVRAYRAGLLPEDRRRIEKQMAAGELLAVISTSALELGIDIGDLDLCLLVGYPGSTISLAQRGGRIGRGGQPSAVIMVAGDDALDRYYLRHPQELAAGRPEAAVINPDNPVLLAGHLECAAAELPLEDGENWLQQDKVKEAVADLVKEGRLLLNARGTAWHARRRQPQREVDLRGGGRLYTLFCLHRERRVGEIDAVRVHRETHPGAIYLHNGITYRVSSVSAEQGRVLLEPVQVDYHTMVRSDKEIVVYSQAADKAVWGTRAGFGRLRITDRVTGFDCVHSASGRVIRSEPLEVPAVVFDTEGLWWVVDDAIQMRLRQEGTDFEGGIHALEHAVIGMLPLLVLADRDDLGGVSTSCHPQTGTAAVFIYDGLPGGAGLCRQAFAHMAQIFEHTREAIAGCDCAKGCPACVHSPKCGSGNNPIDKQGALDLLDALAAAATAGAPARTMLQAAPAPRPCCPVARGAKRYGVFDVETRRSAAEVGGWHRADRMGISCVVVYDAGTDRYEEFLQDDMPALVALLQEFDLVIGFNSRRFDYRVLSGLSPFAFDSLPTLDIMDSVVDRLGYRLSLDALAAGTLGLHKSGDGLMALEWWKAGRIRDILDYCRMDVQITRDLYRFGCRKGYLLFDRRRDGERLRIPVDWGDPQTPSPERISSEAATPGKTHAYRPGHCGEPRYNTGDEGTDSG
jgi:DEAD/DEAH box helicase domain-containing protein